MGNICTSPKNNLSHGDRAVRNTERSDLLTSTKPIDKWNVDDVFEWLSRIDDGSLYELAIKFKKNKIRGCILDNVKEVQLIEMDVALGDRMLFNQKKIELFHKYNYMPNNIILTDQNSNPISNHSHHSNEGNNEGNNMQPPQKQMPAPLYYQPQPPPYHINNEYKYCGGLQVKVFSPKSNKIRPGLILSYDENTKKARICHYNDWGKQSIKTLPLPHPCVKPHYPRPTGGGSPQIDAFYEPPPQSVVQYDGIIVQSDMWTCCVCTYTNPLNKHKCEMCGYLRTRYRETRIEHQQQILAQQSEAELAVSGYCRIIEQLLNDNIFNKEYKIIPNGLVHLCLVFYVNTWDFILEILSKMIVKKSASAYFEIRSNEEQEFTLLSKLKKIAEYLLNKADEKYGRKYQMLYLGNTQFRDEILEYEGTLIFLYHLGFVLDSETNDRLICQQLKFNVIKSCIQITNEKCKKMQSKTLTDFSSIL